MSDIENSFSELKVTFSEIDFSFSEKGNSFSNIGITFSDIEVEKEEERMVNGILIKYIQMSGTVKGIKFTYAGYYCSNESGSIQFLSFTGKSLFKDYQNDFEDLLNGLVTLQK